MVDGSVCPAVCFKSALSGPSVTTAGLLPAQPPGLALVLGATLVVLCLGAAPQEPSDTLALGRGMARL